MPWRYDFYEAVTVSFSCAGLARGISTFGLQAFGITRLCMRAAVSICLVLHHSTVGYDMVLAF